MARLGQLQRCLPLCNALVDLCVCVCVAIDLWVGCRRRLDWYSVCMGGRVDSAYL